MTGYTNCAGATGTTRPAGAFNVTNSEGAGTTTDSLYTGTTGSINVFYAHLEQQVGLCATVKTAVSLGVHPGRRHVAARSNDGEPAAPPTTRPPSPSAWMNVSPLSMAAAYATPAAGGVYCAPVALTKIVNDQGTSSGCRQPAATRRSSPGWPRRSTTSCRACSAAGGTAAGLGLSGYQAAGKTGTSNVASGNGTPYAAFAGYTTGLTGYVSVFNPESPTQHTMDYTSACYRLEGGGQDCPAEMFGANAPASVWHMTFDHANLSGSHDFAVGPGGQRPVERRRRHDGQAAAEAEEGEEDGNGGGNGGGGNGGGG